VIARLWRGRTAHEDADEYTEYVKRSGIAAQQALPGHIHTLLLRHLTPTATEFIVLSLWRNLDSILEFAGTDPTKAVYYPKDESLLLEMEPTVLHYEVVAGGFEKVEDG